MKKIIELNTIQIIDETSIVEARNKILVLAQDLNFDAISSTRLATISSELSRVIYKEGTQACIAVSIYKYRHQGKKQNENEGAYGLKFVFKCKTETLPVSGAHIFFDEFKTSNTDDGFSAIEAFRFFKDPEFELTDTFIEAEREKLMRISKAELYNEVKRKNEELVAILDKLEKKNVELEEMTRLKSEFLANMSHELRTPLNSIIGFSNRIIKKAGDILPEKQLKNINIVLRNGHHLLGLINSLLDISKIEVGKMDVFPEEFELIYLILEVKELTQSLFIDKGLKFKTELPEKQITLYTDKTKLKQILINLISNAVKFTEEGGITISVGESEPLIPDTDTPFKLRTNCVSICVKDSGIGISSSEIEYVFDEFRQVDGSSTRQEGGTGLGLSIAKKFTELLKGEIVVNSIKGEGSEFTITIPVRFEDKVNKNNKDSLEEPEASLPYKKNRLSVLCIDDNPEALDLLEEYLSDEGYHVTRALSADEGVKKAKIIKPFAITLDIQMPFKDGWTTLQELKEDNSTRDIPVIIASIMDNKALAYKLGASGYLQKPFEPDQLLKTIKKTLPQKKGKILVVDDEPDVIELISQIFEENDEIKASVMSAENGEKALKILKETTPDLIMLDLMMPVMDGFHMLDALQKKEDWARIPVIIITAKILDKNELDLLNSHTYGIIKKEGMSADIVLKEISKTLNNIK